MDFDIIDLGQKDYRACLAYQKQLQDARRKGRIKNTLILVEHEPVITIGRSGSACNIVADKSELDKNNIALHYVDRGGDVTMHCPGQLVVYPILDLKNYRKDLHWYMRNLEQVVIELLANYSISAKRVAGFTGVWVDAEKIASIGISVSGWVTSHGLSLNVSSDMSYFSKIKPCGIDNCKMTSMQELLGLNLDMQELKNNFCKYFSQIFTLGTSINAQRLSLAYAADK